MPSYVDLRTKGHIPAVVHLVKMLKNKYEAHKEAKTLRT